MLRSLLFLGCDYKENGILPYSAYFYKDFLENKLYASALSINLCLLLLLEESKASIKEFTSDHSPSLPLYLVKAQLKSTGRLIEAPLTLVYTDEQLMINVLGDIALNVLSIYQKEKTLLPNSYKEVF